MQKSRSQHLAGMRIIYFLVAAICCIFPFQKSHAQQTADFDQRWVGNWVGKDTAISISPQLISRLYQTGNSFTPSSFAHEQFNLLDSPMLAKTRLLQGWIFSSYTAMRLYHKNESRGETSIEAVVYKAIRLELLDKHTLKLSVSKTFKVQAENKSPAVKLNSSMLKTLAQQGYLRSFILKRQPAPDL